MCCELNDYEWAAIKPMLPNKPRGDGGVATAMRSILDRAIENTIAGGDPG
jgi:transposase